MSLPFTYSPETSPFKVSIEKQQHKAKQDHKLNKDDDNPFQQSLLHCFAYVWLRKTKSFVHVYFIAIELNIAIGKCIYARLAHAVTKNGLLWPISVSHIENRQHQRADVSNVTVW